MLIQRNDTRMYILFSGKFTPTIERHHIVSYIYSGGHLNLRIETDFQNYLNSHSSRIYIQKYQLAITIDECCVNILKSF